MPVAGGVAVVVSAYWYAVAPAGPVHPRFDVVSVVPVAVGDCGGKQVWWSIVTAIMFRTLPPPVFATVILCICFV